MRFLLSGLRHYHFLNETSNPIYIYKRLQQMLYKVIIKLNLLNKFISENDKQNLNTKFENMNNNNKEFKKNYEAFKQLEKQDELSDYDDQGEFINHDHKSNLSVQNSGSHSPKTATHSNNQV